MQLALPLVSDEPSPSHRVPDPVRAAVGEPRFVRHCRARRYILRVLDDGTLRVTLPRWGSKREALRFVDASQRWIADQRARRSARLDRPSYDEAAARRRAVRDLPIQLREMAARHGVEIHRVSIRNQRSRWGSCSRRGSISLNWRLVLVPDFVREYVMLHELMHRRELNHSPRFWRLVAGVCPRMLEARRWLRTEGQALF
jgi:predicted metal-dependent hydrolase